MISQQSKKNLKFIFSLLIFYIVLFEFLLPRNNFIPQPIIFYESFLHLWSVYHLLFPLLSTATIVYLSILISFVFVFYFRIVIIKNIISYRAIFQVFNIFKYFPAFFIVLLFSLWFKDSLSAEIVFAILVSSIMLIKKINQLILDVKNEYIIFAHQINPNKMFSEVYWKSILPKLFSYLYDLQFYLWILILIYEFISESYGIGLIYKQAFTYNDIGAIFSISVTVSLIIWLSNFLIKLIEKKKIYWDNE